MGLMLDNQAEDAVEHTLQNDVLFTRLRVCSHGCIETPTTVGFSQYKKRNEVARSGSLNFVKRS